MIDKIAQLQNFLKEDDRREIRFVNFKTDENLTRKYTLNKILASGASDLQAYIYKVVADNPNVLEIKVEKFTSNGSASTKLFVEKQPTIITLSLGEDRLVKDAPTVESVGASNSQNPNNTHTMEQTQMGLSAAMVQHVELLTKAKEADRLAAEIIEVKEKLKKVEQKNDDLHSELREAKSDLKTAEKFKDLELKTAALEKKPFVDPETAKLAIGAVGPLLEAFMNKGQNLAQGGGLSGVENLSTIKQQLFSEIKKNDFTDAQANNLMSILILLIDGNAFINQQLATLIEQYNSGN